MWDHENDAQTAFYTAMKNMEAGEEATEWFRTFDQMVGTIDFFDPTETDTATSLEGRWISVEYPRHTIEFKGDIKRDLYDDKVMSEHSFEITDGPEEGKRYITHGDTTYGIDELTEDTLVLIHLPRGNTLSFTR